ncbi:MAG: Outer membrane porin [uncultured Paraburkholderia sp.]|uniref:porin n=1 Tax=uncultured Paraburkholderia sp. TaxID=1822466 RepID=UPI00259686BE|nr:porin [uncultured Paraburkholderia sp.]CAH2894511.1 MAG: Outer membrane porin [uncultured Paraburkholderia sp.]CAH2910615.1 MAG: Outer membrane porin [uncultured Paraburkholderia sp.]
MKKAICLAALGMVAGSAYAQSSVTLYGVLDVGINYISNDGGKANVDMSSGVIQGNRWGLLGSEDLGGGLKAIFRLESGFSLTNGTMGQGGRLFGRQAYTGLSSNTYGTLTAGRQYDSVVDYVQQFSGIPYTGLSHPFDNDNFVNSFRVNNSVKYASPDIHGLKFGALYGFSNSANTGAPNAGFANNRVWSVGGAYSGGPFSVGAAYMHLNTPNSNTVGAVSGDYINLSTTGALQVNGLTSAVVRSDVLGVGGAYAFNGGRASLVYSHTSFDSATDRLTFDNYEANAIYFFTPFFSLAGIYSFTDGKLRSKGTSPKYHQVQLIGDYALSKTTDVYLLGAYQRAAGDATVASIAPDTFGTGGAAAPDASTTKNQVLVRLALRHKF